MERKRRNHTKRIVNLIIVDESGSMSPASTTRIENAKSGNVAGERENCRPLVIGIPGIVLVVGLIGGCERIIVILRHCSSLPENGSHDGTSSG